MACCGPWRRLFLGKPPQFAHSPSPSLCLVGGTTAGVWNPRSCHEMIPRILFFEFNRWLLDLHCFLDCVLLIQPWFPKLSTKTYRVAFWMRKFGSMSFKRTWVWSTSPSIQSLDLGSLTAEEKETSVSLTTRYKDAKGRTKFKGNGKLKPSQ